MCAYLDSVEENIEGDANLRHPQNRANKLNDFVGFKNLHLLKKISRPYKWSQLARMGILSRSVYVRKKQWLPYWAKLCWVKLSSGETIRLAKFSPLNEKFVTFAQRKVSPNKKSILKWITSKPTSDLSHLDKLWLCCWAKLCLAKFSSSEIIRLAKFLSPFKKFITFARQSFAR